MSVDSVLRKAFARLHEAPHGFKPSLVSFQEVDTLRVKRDLKVIERAEERGNNELPPQGGNTLDQVENEIIDHMDSEKQRSRQLLSDQLEIYADRLASLNFEGQLSDIPIGLRNALSEFHAIIRNGLNDLHPKRRGLLERERDLKYFQTDNGLKRRSYYPSSAKRVFLIGIIFVVGLLETIGNTSFLAKGNQLGIIGAYSEALVISILNLGAAFGFGRIATNLVHKSIFRKLIGSLASLTALTVCIVLNLAVAHYREVSGTVLDAGGRAAIAALAENPIGLNEFQSWILFGMGALFAVISFVDGLKFDDPYPGYGHRSRIVDEARREYLTEVEHYTDEMRDARDSAVEILRETKNDLAYWRKEHTAILESRKRLIESFNEHMSHLERAGNSLLSDYRDANRQAREGKAPARFKNPWTMSRPNLDYELPVSILTPERMDELISTAALKLEQGVTDLYNAHDEGLKSFDALNDMVPDDVSLTMPGPEVAHGEKQ